MLDLTSSVSLSHDISWSMHFRSLLGSIPTSDAQKDILLLSRCIPSRQRSFTAWFLLPVHPWIVWKNFDLILVHNFLREMHYIVMKEIHQIQRLSYIWSSDDDDMEIKCTTCKTKSVTITTHVWLAWNRIEWDQSLLPKHLQAWHLLLTWHAIRAKITFQDPMIHWIKNWIIIINRYNNLISILYNHYYLSKETN